jgi:hypothetical protein
MSAVVVSVLVGMLALGATLTLLGLALTAALARAEATTGPSPFPFPSPRGRIEMQASKPSLRLLSRALFASRSPDAITLDCTLVRAEHGGGWRGGLDLPPAFLPPAFVPPAGLPFTLRLRAPEADWFAGRVEELLREWAEENRELVLELREDRGRVRTTIASGDSSVYLDLAEAAGFSQR